jgi:cell division septation protein DedD
MNTPAKNQQIEFEVFPKDNKSNYSYLSGVKNEDLREGASINVVFSNQSIIIILICVFMSLVASFSLGVEKGKLIARNNLTDDRPLGAVVSITPQASVAPEAIKIPNQMVPITPASNSKAGIPSVKQEANQNILPLVQTATPIVEIKDNAVPKKGYTIQVATLNTKESAKSLCDVLAKKGIAAFSRPSGKYMIVLAGDFAKKEEAQAKLRELKKTYTDCFIKKI